MKVDFEDIRSDLKKNKYPLIGSGSGRLVFDLGNGYVVKVAKNKRGIAQNIVEYQISSKDHSNIFAKVTAVSENNYYLIMEKAEKIRNITEIWRYYEVRNNRGLFHREEFALLAKEYNLLWADLCRPINWGIVHGRPVIIDYGFTKEVKRKYYSFF